MPTRRDFLKTSAAVGGSVLVGTVAPGLLAAAAPERARAPMRILILGGTGFIGPHLVRHAVARGHTVTIFTRGRRDSSMLPAEVERLVGDRNGQLGALEGKKWDAVFDDSATNPDWVRQSVALLKGNVGQYSFTSSTGVYYPYLKKGLDESTPPPLEGDQNDPSAAYGTAKAKCEKIVLDTFGDGGIVIRPSYIVGPGDTTDRFPYWPVRLARGGEVLVPGKRDDSAQFIDVRDLVEFMVKVVEDKRSGPFNVAGPRDAITIRAFVEEAARALDARVTFIQVDDHAFLAEHKIDAMVPWVLPVGNDLGHTSISNARAKAAGLGFRPIATTVRDTLAWWPTVPEARRNAPRFALTPEQEATVLAAWKAKKG
ncbi:MAG TPA: NAD-dependent epimerase/dehydratase family protein [Gemmatimonadaceae bacterium]|jgi:2'-hydroxyisoflavone reductase|nr:NAD-dependent epimerase/dehydratase family protein [Gemmatimonadaceae bacterium]